MATFKVHKHITSCITKFYGINAKHHASPPVVKVINLTAKAASVSFSKKSTLNEKKKNKVLLLYSFSVAHEISAYFKQRWHLTVQASNQATEMKENDISRTMSSSSILNTCLKKVNVEQVKR